jgi:RNA recognition motif-containing protein
MPVLGAGSLFPNAALMQQPMFPILMMDPSKQAVKSEDESSSRKRKQRSKASGKQEEQSKHGEDTRTTVMLRNLPRDFSRAALLKLLDDQGFAGKYNFLYIPVDFVRQVSLGYAFVNMATPEIVKELWAAFDGFSTWPVACEKVCRVNWSSPHQGYEEHVQRYRNSPLMHKYVPDECRPVLLEKGVRVDFPPPTKSLRAPRLRASRQRCPFWDQEQAEASDNELAREDVAEP